MQIELNYWNQQKSSNIKQKYLSFEILEHLEKLKYFQKFVHRLLYYAIIQQ